MKKKFLKGMALTLALTLTGTFLPKTDLIKTAKAENSHNEVPINVFATKEQVLDKNNFNLEGDKSKVGKILFGLGYSNLSTSNTDLMYWYIAGKDNGIGKDNIVLFAASPFQQKVSFCDISSQPDTNAPNHYGNSNLRSVTNNLSTNIYLFSTEEQSLILPTSFSTYDVRNKTNYTLTDKLYSPRCVYENNLINKDKISVGTNDDIIISNNLIESYYTTGEKTDSRNFFWLRSPYYDGTDNVSNEEKAVKDTLFNIKDYPVTDQNSVRPAFALDASALLFVSNVSGSFNINTGQLTTLYPRFSGNISSTGSYNGNTIRINHNENDGKLNLFIQGYDGKNDWFASFNISNSQEIQFPTEIYQQVLMDKLNYSESNPFSLSDCKIWLQRDIGAANHVIRYAKMIEESSAPAKNEISKIAITDIEEPIAGKPLDTASICKTEGIANTNPPVSYTVKNITERDAASGNADFNKIYTATVILSALDGYVFAKNISVSDVTLNENPASSVTLNEDSTLTVTYDFTTEKAKLINVTQPENISDLENGTERTAEALGLPSSVTITTEDPSVKRAGVTWDLENLANGTSYDPSNPQEQTFQVNGIVNLPENISNPDNLPLHVTITITVLPQGMIAAPRADIPSGIYTENQTVSLTCNTEGAVIHYTTDGSIPDVSSPLYTEKISINGAAGSSVTTVIHAIAVKEDQQSAVSSFTYTIELPAEHTHHWHESWTFDKDAHWHECLADRCTITANNEKEGYAPHTEDQGTVTSPPTEEHTGTLTYRCTICGYEIRTETLPMIHQIGEDVRPENPEARVPETESPETDFPEIEDSKDQTNLPLTKADAPAKNQNSSVSVSKSSQIKRQEPKTGDGFDLKLYLYGIGYSCFFYLLLYFLYHKGSITEERKQEVVHSYIRWGRNKKGFCPRKWIAMIMIFTYLAYYHSIGKKISPEKKSELA